MKRIGGWIENSLLFGWLLLIPTQLGRHFWPEWSLVLGVRVDYLSPTLYLVDLLWVGWIVSKIFNQFFKLNNIKPIYKLVLILGLIGINIWVARYRWVAVYRWLRWGQMIVTIDIVRKDKNKFWKYLGIIIPIWLTIEVFLGLGEIVKGGSLNGWWYWLGERRFNLLTTGVAKITWESGELLRAYGTFSHPNSFGAFILLTLVIWKRWKTKRLGWWVVWWVGVIGIGISGGRTIWLLSIFNFQFSIFNKFFNEKSWKRKIGWLMVGIGVWLGLLGLMEKLGGWDSSGWDKRWMLMMAAINMTKTNWLTGVGLGNFVAQLPNYWQRGNIFWLQPVHNIPLLLISELGILGILIFNFQFSIFNKLINELILNKNKLLMEALIIVGITGMVDHYWITLPQNWWLLAIVLGLVW